MKYCSKTDVGKKRENNEDRFVCERIADNAVILAVCDGMGGAKGGAVAASVAAESFLAEIKYQVGSRLDGGKLFFADPESEVAMLLDSAVANANYEVWSKAQDDKSLRGMGTTLTAALIFEDSLRVFTVNVGDSRVYRIEENTVQRLTKDHSYVQHLADIGEITQKEADNHPDRNIITRALGISIRAEADIKEAEVNSGDMLLLCSDGLYGMLTDDEIHGVAAFMGASLETKLEKLVSLANDAGGDDNITVVLAEL